jgi:hypothetical protein
MVLSQYHVQWRSLLLAMLNLRVNSLQLQKILLQLEYWHSVFNVSVNEFYGFLISRVVESEQVHLYKSNPHRSLLPI